MQQGESIPGVQCDHQTPNIVTILLCSNKNHQANDTGDQYLLFKLLRLLSSFSIRRESFPYLTTLSNSLLSKSSSCQSWLSTFSARSKQSDAPQRWGSLSDMIAPTITFKREREDIYVHEIHTFRSSSTDRTVSSCFQLRSYSFSACLHTSDFWR